MSHFKGSQDEIELQKTLDYYTQQEGSNILKEKIAILAHKGRISLSGLDFTELCRLYSCRNLNIQEVNKITSDRKSYASLESRCDELMSYGLTITRKVQNGIEYFVEAVRP